MFGALRNRASDAHLLRWYHYRNLPQEIDGSDEEYAIKKDAALFPERPWYKSLLRALLWNIGVFALLALAFWLVHEQPKKRASFPPTCRVFSLVVYRQNQSLTILVPMTVPKTFLASEAFMSGKSEESDAAWESLMPGQSVIHSFHNVSFNNAQRGPWLCSG